MSKLCIAHLSDTHILRNYQQSGFFDNIQLRITPDNFVASGLEKLAKYQPDILTITGDLVHEGNADDYRYLKELIQKYLGNIPVFYALGNHDIKKEFYRGILDLEDDSPYFKSEDYQGYRIISIDTAKELDPNGSIDEKQLAWLEEELKTPSKNGSIFLAHHPIKSTQTWYQVYFQEKLTSILKNSDVFLYLCGHAHFNDQREIEKVKQFTAESFAFGVEGEGDQVIYTEARGFNIYWIENQDVICHNKQLFPYKDTLYLFQSVEDSLN